ncbi:nitric oxide-associated protein 1 isoform X1 [Euwallacea fornicatus]|uniref:nitric oxide-associated protein 1 isoform X1 n=1 Tax=Euwallacea fornicatus TaxID=995702 RepID=UPI00338E8179
MLLLKRFQKNILNQNYYRICTSSLNNTKAKLDQKDGVEPSEAFIKEYEEKLLYNSVIDWSKPKSTYQQNLIAMKMRQNLERQIKAALQTVRPLPVSLKYFCEEKSTNSSNTIPQTLQEDFDKHTQSLDYTTKFPYININSKVEDDTKPIKPVNINTIKEELKAKKEILDKSPDNWMTYYENYEKDLKDIESKSIVDWQAEGSNINFGTADPRCPISSTSCGGCGAYLHCKDAAIPGYIPSEIFKNSFTSAGANLESIYCQRCHFLKEYNIALQVRVSADDYPKVLKSISFNSSLVLLLVDLIDFPCSIWPGLADILGPKSRIVVVGNKLDLLPKDDHHYLARIKQLLIDNLRLSGFGNSNIKHVELISAKTGYGIENLISSLHEIKIKGDVYIVGTTNVGKSSLFNLLLKSDFCKIQAADLIQKATTSPWPGTTLNLLKFPITKFSGYRLHARNKRLEKLREIEKRAEQVSKEALLSYNKAKYATPMGIVERTVDHLTPLTEQSDTFSTKGSFNMSGQTRLGINEKSPEFAFGKWCYDTPGVVHPDQILHLLTTEELVQTLPREIIRAETFCVKPGTSLFIAGLARLDYIQGSDSIRLTVFRANSLPITFCKLEKADSIYQELLGSDLFVVPIFKGDRKEKWPGLELAKSFKIFGKSRRESSYDVVLSNAGWVAVNCGLANYEFQAWTPQKRGVHIRDCLLPKAVTLRGRRIRKSIAYKKHRFI